MKIGTHRAERGLTLVEMLLSVACGAFILAAIVAAGVAMQRSYGAVESYSTAEADQLRVLDYIAMDSRRATSVAVNTVTVNGISEPALVITLPQYFSSSTSSTATPNNPSLGSGSLSYGADIVTVTYQQSGTNFTREVKVTDSTGTTVRSDNTTAIAKNVSSFTVDPTIVANSGLATSVSCTIMFFPTFTHMTGYGTWRNGGSAPSSGTGADGDWYVIDTTASDPTTVGDVYLKASGSYSKIQNVKATTVACNVFLRNASARN